LLTQLAFQAIVLGSLEVDFWGGKLRNELGETDYGDFSWMI